MNKTLLLVIDLQKSFINENTEFLPQKIESLISENKFDSVAFTRFINNVGSVYTTKLNWFGCIDESDRAIVIDTNDNEVFDKTVYTALNSKLKDYLIKENIKKVYLCGIDSECCVLKTAFDMFEAGIEVYILSEYCYSTLGEERHLQAMEILKRNIGKDSVI